MDNIINLSEIDGSDHLSIYLSVLVQKAQKQYSNHVQDSETTMVLNTISYSRPEIGNITECNLFDCF